MMMTYKRAKASGGAAVIVMVGEFTDPGVLGPQFVGNDDSDAVCDRAVVGRSGDHGDLLRAATGDRADRVILMRK